MSHVYFYYYRAIAMSGTSTLFWADGNTMAKVAARDLAEATNCTKETVRSIQSHTHLIS